METYSLFESFLFIFSTFVALKDIISGEDQTHFKHRFIPVVKHEIENVQYFQLRTQNVTHHHFHHRCLVIHDQQDIDIGYENVGNGHDHHQQDHHRRFHQIGTTRDLSLCTNFNESHA